MSKKPHIKENKLDLHGIQHREVEQIVEDWVITQYNDNRFPCQVITGNSDSMKKLVIEVLKRNDFQYQIGDYFGTNKGYIQVNG